MSGQNLKLSICHIYPSLLNIYGDFGNILTLKKRCICRNIDINIENINIEDEINISKFDLYFMGGGQNSQQIIVSKELQKHKEALSDASSEGAVFLGICGGYQLFGRYYLLTDSTVLEGINILDIYTVASEDRLIGNVTVKTDFLSPETLVGFENHSGQTFLEEGTMPFAKVIKGNGNNFKGAFEGARKNNVFGTYLHGPLLPKNPHFADYLVELALEHRYKDKIFLNPLNDDLEYETHLQLVNKKY